MPEDRKKPNTAPDSQGQSTAEQEMLEVTAQFPALGFEQDTGIRRSIPKKKLDPEQQRLRKEEQARTARRRSRQFIGLAMAVLVVVGAISIVRGGVDLVRNLLDSQEERLEYQSRFEPLVWFNILPFPSVSQVNENDIKQVAIWGVLNAQKDSLGRNQYGELLIPATSLDAYAAQLFGPNFRFSGHSSFTDPVEMLNYLYDSATKMYTVPVTSLQPQYLPSVVEIKREGAGIRRVTMGYVSTRAGNDQMVATPDYGHPALYMDYMLRRDGSEYYLYAIERNTTYTPPNASLPSSSQAPASSSQTASSGV